MTQESSNSLQRLPLIAGGALCSIAFAILAVQSNVHGGATLADMMWVFAVSGSVVVVCFALASKNYITLSWTDVLFYALLFRIIALFGAPVLEDDHYRYLWDGWMFIHQGSPYGIPPTAFFDSASVPEAFESILDGINYPHIETVYGPTAQWLFAAAYGLAPASVWPLQLFAVIADLGIIWLLYKMVSVRWVLLYSWSFLVIKEYAFTAHIDVIGAFLLLLAIYLRRDATNSWSPLLLSIAVGCLLAAATGIKIFCLLAVPYLLQNDWRGWLAFLAFALALAAPFGIAEAWFPQGLSAMGAAWLFNAPVYLPLSYVISIEDFQSAKVIGLVILGGIVVIGFLRVCGPALWPIWDAVSTPTPRVAPDRYVGTLSIGFCALFVLSPVLNPWYLVWWLPIACLHPTRTPWVCSGALILSYVTGLNLGDASLQLYGQPIWVLGVEFGLIFAALAWDIVSPLSRVARA